MTKLTLTLGVLGTLATLSAPAAAETKLTTTTYTASPGGFLVTSTLISGDKEAVLIDAQFSLAEAHRLVAQILESKKTLTTVYITHSHPDHYFGLEVIKQAFPKAKLVTLAGTATEIGKTAAGKVKQWSGMYGNLVPAKPVMPTGQKLAELKVDGVSVEIHGPVQGDSVDNSYVWIPSTKTLIAGDLVFAGVHPWTADGKADQRAKWEKTLDDLAALNPTTVIAGHRDPKAKEDVASTIKFTKDYLVAFDAAAKDSKTSEELQTRMKAKYKDLQLDVILQFGAGAQFPAAPAAPAKK